VVAPRFGNLVSYARGSEVQMGWRLACLDFWPVTADALCQSSGFASGCASTASPWRASSKAEPSAAHRRGLDRPASLRDACRMSRLVRATLLSGGLALLAGAALAAAPDDFYVRNAQDLVDLCTVSAEDPVKDAAIHFCHGFASGAWQYHVAQANGPQGRRLVCPPDSATRHEALAGFVEWSGRHPEHMGEPAVEALFRFLIERWPCPAPAASGGAGGSPR
jgi:hypothetical protein